MQAQILQEPSLAVHVPHCRDPKFHQLGVLLAVPLQGANLSEAYLAA